MATSSALPAVLLAQIEVLSKPQKVKLVERMVRDLASNEPVGDPAGLSFLGCLEGQGDLLDEIAEGAMQARERDPLRRPGA